MIYFQDVTVRGLRLLGVWRHGEGLEMAIGGVSSFCSFMYILYNRRIHTLFKLCIHILYV